MPFATLYLTGRVVTPDTRTLLHATTADILVEVFGAPRPIVAVRIVEELSSQWSVAGVPLDGAGNEQGNLKTGVLARITMSETTATDEQIAEAIAALSELFKESLGSNALPPYIVFEAVPNTRWGYKGKTLAQIYQTDRRASP
jgi:phenylpyruvate tautomerase PptA (4-oxalocrotonate tautomerase family)